MDALGQHLNRRAFTYFNTFVTDDIGSAFPADLPSNAQHLGFDSIGSSIRGTAVVFMGS